MRESRVFIFGAGKVGRALAHALRRVGSRVVLRAARKGLPKRAIVADIVILALRDRDLAETVARLVATRGVDPRAVVVHASGALTSECLAPLRAVCAGVAQMHPMISFASLTRFPTLTHGNVHVEGDAVAVRRARALAKTLGMTPRHFTGLDTVGYHAAAALLANGAVALAAQAADVLSVAGVDKVLAPHLLGPLLRSVADNIDQLGFPGSLTGPVRRGDASAITRGAATLEARVPHVLPLYRAAVLAQIPLARALGEVPQASLDAIADALARAPK